MVYGVKITNMKGGRRYGPYPREPGIYYLYESVRQGSSVKKVFRGKGPLPTGSPVVLQESMVAAEESKSGLHEG